MPMFFIHGLIVAWLLRTLLLKLGAGRLMDPVVQTRHHRGLPWTTC